MKRPVYIALLMATIAGFATGQPTSRRDITRDRMRDLQGFAGSWRADVVFHGRQGPKDDSREIGSYTVSWALNDTYLRWESERHDPVDTIKKQLMLTMLTYNPDSGRYEQTYFYSGSAMKVVEYGTFDRARGEFTTSAIVPREDGVRDEFVRTVTYLRSKDELVYEHFSRYGNEAVERNDVTITLHRK